MMTHVSLSRTGRFVAVRRADAIEIVDAIGTAPCTRIPGDARDFACIGTQLWILRDRAIARHALAAGRLIDMLALDVEATHLVSDGEDTAIVEGEHRILAGAAQIAVPPALAAFALGGRRVALVQPDGVHVLELGRRESTILRTDGVVLGVTSLLGGRVVAVRARTADHDVWTVWQGRTRVHRVEAPPAAHVAIAGATGEALAITNDRWTRIDLRYGHIRGSGTTPIEAEHVGISADGQHVLLASGDEIAHMPAVALFATPARADQARLESDDALSHGSAPPSIALPTGASEVAAANGHHVPLAEPDTEITVASAHEPDDDVIPLALGAPLVPLAIDAAGEHAPYASSREHLDDMLDLVAARAARAIAEAWNTGRISGEGDRQPFEREVRALLGHAPGFAPAELGEADARLAQMATRQAGRVRASLAAGVRLPFIELMRELDLSPIAGHVLVVTLAPYERGEIARLYGILGNDASRPLVDRFLIELVLAGTSRAHRAAIAAELAPAAPLRGHGVLQIASNQAIAVDEAVIARLRDPAGAPCAVRPLADLTLAASARRDLVDATRYARPSHDPLRLVLRGRRGAGRRSALAALAARIGRGIADIDVARLPRAGGVLPAMLQQELRRAALRGCIPIASGLDTVDTTDVELQDRIRHVLRAHAGPIVVRAPLDGNLPLDPGHVTVTLAPLDETARTAFWHAALTRAGLHCRDVDALAARWRIGPGVVEEVIAQACARGVTGDADDALHAVARQHVDARLAHIATPVRRLAAWENVALPDDMVDSIRELVGRIAHRKTVLEHWGFDAKVASARGLTALFYGPPGTGKSMVAGLIARELGLDLYRIDLSRVVSKWIGETEKNLAEVFDAAEDGQVVLLFDEADSLFAKRTEVKTSVDRYANLEVNYLLQRLDSFEGIAILTTNLDGSIDPAFKRRMSLRLQFPFPDEEMRQRLWATHIPAGAPTAGDFDFRALARKYELSGGYIRNSTLRAAYLAAQERRPLAQAHLVRAIALEYRELGKLAPGGRME